MGHHAKEELSGQSLPSQVTELLLSVPKLVNLLPVAKLPLVPELVHVPEVELVPELEPVPEHVLVPELELVPVPELADVPEHVPVFKPDAKCVNLVITRS